MSFHFDWPRHFPASFYESAKTALEQALNAGQKLSLVADRIRVIDLNMGNIPPELDLLSLDELSAIDGSFKGTFMLSYSGDALISLAANLHVNPLTQYKHALEMLATPSVLLTTAEMFVQLTLSHLRLRCVIALSFSKTTGLSLAFKDDPLESLNVSSSFDSFGVVQQFIQSEIENQLRERFRRDLPSLIHRLSQRWCADMAQQSTLHADAPIIVEQGVHHRPESSFNKTTEREPDESFPYDHDGNFVHTITELQDDDGFDGNSRQYRDSDVESDGGHEDRSVSSLMSNAGDASQRSLPSFSHSGTPLQSSEHVQGIPIGTGRSASVGGSPPDRHGISLSWASTSSWTSQGTSSQNDDSLQSVNHMHGPKSMSLGSDSLIIESLQRTGSTFATTFSKPSIALSAQDLQNSLHSVSTKMPTTTGRREDSLQQKKLPTYASLGLTADSPLDKAPQATRKRFHRIESAASPKNSPNASPRKSRTLREAKSRDKLRLRREDLDEYFPVSEEGSSASKAGPPSPQNGPPHTSRPSLLNPDIPVLVPMNASLLHSGRTEFPSKNSLRRTMMSSRLRERERDNIANKRPVIDSHFFTENRYR